VTTALEDSSISSYADMSETGSLSAEQALVAVVAGPSMRELLGVVRALRLAYARRRETVFAGGGLAAG
jgi:hypothetical protein